MRKANRYFWNIVRKRRCPPKNRDTCKDRVDNIFFVSREEPTLPVADSSFCIRTLPSSTGLISVVSVSDFRLPLRLELRMDDLYRDCVQLVLLTASTTWLLLMIIFVVNYLFTFVSDDRTDIARSNIMLPFTLGVNAPLISFNSESSFCEIVIFGNGSNPK